MRILFVALLLLPIYSSASLGQGEVGSEPSTVYWESSRLVETKGLAKNPDDELRPILTLLRSNADKALARGPYSVTFKKEVPPSGDKHDYMSFSRYWWPNPDTTDGLPYIRRDGEVNWRLVRRGDRNQLSQLLADIETLSLAYYLLQEAQYADHAVELIRVWFLDSETKMNPHLKFGQAVPGRSDGRGVGIIDTRGFINLLDALALLSSSDAYEAVDEEQLKQWFADFLVWLRTSDLAKDEADAENNHGSWYAAQTSRIALFVGDTDFATEIVQRVQRERIPSQFAEDGSQPEELERTQSLHYSLFNLEALSIVARVGEHLGIDLWQSTPTSGNLQPGLRFLIPYLLSEKHWSFAQIEPFSLSRGVVGLLRMASVRYHDPGYLTPIGQIPLRHPEHAYAGLLFQATTQVEKSPAEVSVTVTKNSSIASPEYELPDISQYTVDYVLSQVPTKHNGTAQVGPTDGERILEETFRKDRREGFQERQGSPSTRVIKLQGGAITLDEVSRQIDDETILSSKDGIVTLRLPILVQADATLIIDGNTTQEVRLSTDKGAFIANAGTLFVLQTKVTSWDELDSAPSELENKPDFRPFVSSYIRSRTYLAGSSFHNLGYHAPTSYGISLSSQPEREEPEKKDQWPTGVLVGNEFHGLYYGFYSYEARGVKIVDNKYVDCILYGIDPHDRSTELIIAGNTTTATREKHGIIGSRGISDSFIFNNTTHGNAGSGIMLDRQCTGNVISNNKVFDNNQGIAIYESPSNVIAKNLVVQNNRSGVRARNSRDIMVFQNEIVANGDYGLEASAKRLDDHAKRADRGDTYTQSVSISIVGNVITGNRGGIMKGTSVNHLRLHHVETDADLSRIRVETGLSDLTLDTEDDRQFGSALKPFSERLGRVFDESMPVVELRQSAISE